jgi:protease-4
MSKKKYAFVFLIIGFFIVAVFALIFVLNIVLLDGNPFAKSVAIIEVKGVIMESEDVMRRAKELREDNSIAAVVLRVDSPGGAVAPSQEIYEELKKLAAEKVLVTSMGGVAASGGYYVACAADYIFANPGTTTGSIGVLFETINAEELLDIIGLEWVVLKSGRLKDVGSPVREMTPEERAFLQQFIENIYQQFVDTVAQERGLSEDEIRKISDARILSGEQALELRLVDELGNLEDAIDKAAELAGISGEPRVIYPKKKELTLFSLLFEDMIRDIIKSFFGERLRVDYRYVP